jgi:hypothetical protein
MILLLERSLVTLWPLLGRPGERRRLRFFTHGFPGILSVVSHESSRTNPKRFSIPNFIRELLPCSCPQAENQCYSCHICRTPCTILASGIDGEYLQCFATGLLDMTFRIFAVRVSCPVTVVRITGAELRPQTPLAWTEAYQRDL